MKVDTSNLNPSAKFYFDDDNPKDGHITLRSLSIKEINEISGLCTKKQPPEYRRGVRYEIPAKVDEKLQMELLWDKAIVDWKGIEEAKTDKAVPCTTENKIKFMKTWAWFALFVGNSLDQLNIDLTATPKDLEIKN